MEAIDGVAQYLGEVFGDGNVVKEGSHTVELHLGNMQYYFVADSSLNVFSNFRAYNGTQFNGNLYDPKFFDDLGLAVEAWRG